MFELKAKLNFTQREILIRCNVGLMSLMSCRGVTFHCVVRITELPPWGAVLLSPAGGDSVGRHGVLFSLLANKEQQAKY